MLYDFCEVCNVIWVQFVVIHSLTHIYINNIYNFKSNILVVMLRSSAGVHWCSCKKTVDFYQTTKHHNSEDHTLHTHCCENLNSNIHILIFRTVHFEYWHEILLNHFCSSKLKNVSTVREQLWSTFKGDFWELVRVHNINLLVYYLCVCCFFFIFKRVE